MSTLYVDNLEPNLGSRVMAAGHVVQVVQSQLNYVDTSSSTFTSLGSVSITPTSTSSKVLVFYTTHIYAGGVANQWRGALFQLKRGSTVIMEDPSGGYGVSADLSDATDRYMTYSSDHFLDSPSTTSAVSYELFGSSRDSLVSVKFNRDTYSSGGRITVMEVAQ